MVRVVSSSVPFPTPLPSAGGFVCFVCKLESLKMVCCGSFPSIGDFSVITALCTTYLHSITLFFPTARNSVKTWMYLVGIVVFKQICHWFLRREMGAYRIDPLEALSQCTSCLGPKSGLVCPVWCRSRQWHFFTGF